jgi:hypothetical protein
VIEKFLREAVGPREHGGRVAGHMMSPAFPRLLGDIGGTNARFGWQTQAGAPVTDVAVLPTDQHPTLVQAIRHYLSLSGKPLPRAGGLAIATHDHRRPGQDDQSPLAILHHCAAARARPAAAGGAQ